VGLWVCVVASASRFLLTFVQDGEFPLSNLGTSTPAHKNRPKSDCHSALSQPLEALQQRARKERTTISWTLDDYNLPLASTLAQGKTVAIVFVQSDSGEQYITVDGNEGDRYDLSFLRCARMVMQTGVTGRI
jgi:hypothetical protein